MVMCLVLLAISQSLLQGIELFSTRRPQTSIPFAMMLETACSSRIRGSGPLCGNASHSRVLNIITVPHAAFAAPGRQFPYPRLIQCQTHSLVRLSLPKRSAAGSQFCRSLRNSSTDVIPESRSFRGSRTFALRVLAIRRCDGLDGLQHRLKGHSVVGGCGVSGLADHTQKPGGRGTLVGRSQQIVVASVVFVKGYHASFKRCQRPIARISWVSSCPRLRPGDNSRRVIVLPKGLRRSPVTFQRPLREKDTDRHPRRLCRLLGVRAHLSEERSLCGRY